MAKLAASEAATFISHGVRGGCFLRVHLRIVGRLWVRPCNQPHYPGAPARTCHSSYWLLSRFVIYLPLRSGRGRAHAGHPSARRDGLRGGNAL